MKPESQRFLTPSSRNDRRRRKQVGRRRLALIVALIVVAAAVFIWAIVPWAWRHPEAFRWLIPSTWPGAAQAGAAAAKLWRIHWQRSPERTAVALRRVARARVRAFFGLSA